MRLINLDSSIKQYYLVLKGFTLGKQEMEILVNSASIADMSSEGALFWKIPFDARLLKPNALNVIEFRIPGARGPGPQDERVLGLALQELSLMHAAP